MYKVIFAYKGKEIIIQCNIQDEFKEICNRFALKAEIDISKIYFIYNGNKINYKLTLREIINEEDLKRNTINILVDEISKNNIINENLIKSKEIICPECNENILIKIFEYKFNLYNCKNGHNKCNILLNEFENIQAIDISKIKCNNCNENNKGNTYNNEFFRCCNCKINICPLCKLIHDKKHKIINYDNKNYICEYHNMSFIKYCKQCKKNICIKCGGEHENHNLVDFMNIFPKEEEIKIQNNEFKIYIDKLNKDINEIIIKLNKVKENIDIYYNIYNNIINNYNSDNINYEILQNINEFQNYNNNIIKDIINIINDNNINNKFNNIIHIYNDMNNKINEININNILNNEYIKKINYKFIKEPKDLKYKLDINNNNGYYGINDIFEIFISYKDNKEYIISKNINNYNLEIFALLDNKQIISLKGHNNHITSVRYFINNKDYNEYLISGDKNYIVIIWDITNNYNLKYQIDSKYNNYIYSCLLIFPHNINENYIITSTICTSNDNDKSATKIYLLNTGKFIKYINNTNNNEIYYLLSWYNEKNNKYYIIQLASEKIIINNLLKDELYSELIHQPEHNHYSGFIYNKDNNDYLCSSSTNGYINIWDLYNKNLFKIINTNNCCLMHIIQWNNKYIIVADYYNKSFKIINIENENILDINGQHTKQVKCIKKINHPKYGESLLSAGRDETIKLWNI